MSVPQAIQAVQNVSSELVVLPDSQAYDAITKSYYTELERELKPSCYLTPGSAKQLSEIVKAIKPFANSLRVAVCGSGQQATPAVANVQDGLTIHLQNLKGIDLNREKNLVSISAGERMGSVYEKVTAVGLGVMGNRHSSGGIGGDALQGKSQQVMKTQAIKSARWSVIFFV